jgi:hypothetical protein
MLLTFSEFGSNIPIAVNPKYVVCVFENTDDKGLTKTFINLLNGNISVNEDYLSVVGQIQGQLKQ